jgi:hypothetical protein
MKIPAEGLPAFTDSNGVTTGQGRMEHRLFKRDQSWCYEAIWALCGRKLRVMVTRNAYDNQSFCKVQAFDDATTEWKFLCDLPFEKARHCYGVNWTNTEADQFRFEQDADDVIEKACRILNPFYADAVEKPAVQPTGEAVSPSPDLLRAIGSNVGIKRVDIIARVTFTDGTWGDYPANC